MKKVGVLVVTYNQKDLTLNWIKEFKKTFIGQNNLYILVLDNNSKDGTYEAVKRQYPDVDIRKLNDNYGCTTGRNIGIVELINMGCEYICTLDNDCIIENSRFFEIMLQAFEMNPDVDGYSAVVRRAHDRSIDTMGSRRTWYGIRRSVKVPTENTKVDYLPGGACVIKASTYMKYGLFDNDYPPIGGQDHAWGIRVTNNGANLHFNPDLEVIHYHPGHRISYAEKDASILQGKALFLKKNPSVIHLLLEIRDCKHYVSHYGWLFTLKHYYSGFRRKIYRKNYEFQMFAFDGLAKYYAQEGITVDHENSVG
jgi:GT2 family glycosyltransferase